MKKISLTINGKNYDIDVEEKFATFLQQRIDKDFQANSSTSHKKLLSAYIGSLHELFTLQNSIENLLTNLEKLEKNSLK